MSDILIDFLGEIIKNSQILVLIANLITLVVAAGTLIFAIKTFRKVCEEIDLFAKSVYGEIYDVAQVERVEFFIPSIAKYKLIGYPQSEEQQFLESIQLQNNTSVEFFLHFVLKKKQHIRTLTVGFGSGMNMKPLVTERTSGFVTKEIASFIREEYVDWHGNYHIEYAHPRTIPKSESMLVSFKAETAELGKYQLTVQIFTDEAVKPYEKKLDVTVE